MYESHELYEHAEASGMTDCDSGRGHAVNMGSPFGTQAATAAQPTPLHHHQHPLLLLLPLPGGQGDVTAASLSAASQQPARHVTEVASQTTLPSPSARL